VHLGGPSRDPGAVPDYYELLGVARDAPTSEIKDAYRGLIEQARDGGTGKKSVAVTADPAELNQAWNVLADPFQRRRYDEQLRTEARDADPDSAAPAPPARTAAKRTAVAKRSLPKEDTAEQDAPPRTILGALKQGKQGPRARGTRENVEPLVLPWGMTPATRGRRIGATAIDLLAGVVGYVLLQFVLYFANLPDAASLAVFYGGLAALVIFYVLAPVARSGQTPGKRLLHLRIVELETWGAPQWNGSLRRYGAPILVTVAIPQLGGFVALFLGFTFLSDPHQRSLLDKFARTVVVGA
jgi:uncharacterized RDD family membrane protein YckC